PFEQQLDLPSLAIQQRDLQRRHGLLVAEKCQPLAGVGILVTDQPHRPSAQLLGTVSAQTREPIVRDAAGVIDGETPDEAMTHAAFGTQDKIRAARWICRRRAKTT